MHRRLALVFYGACHKRHLPKKNCDIRLIHCMYMQRKVQPWHQVPQLQWPAYGYYQLFFLTLDKVIYCWQS